jgi:glycosyltransferase involved in cell wall biosynthesis
VGDRVHFPGVLAHDAVAAVLAAADVAVVPSIHDDAGNVDGLPNVVLEALASGTPLVATPAGGIGAAVTDGENGLLAPERDPAALAAAIGRLHADPGLGSALGARARERAATAHGWAAVAARFETAYAEARHGQYTS